MRVMKSVSKNATSLYIIKSFYDKNGKNTSKIVEALGTLEELQAKHPDQDPLEWAKNYAKALTAKEKREQKDVLIKYSPVKCIEKAQQRRFNVGYLFLKHIYHALKIDEICKDIAASYKFTFDLDEVMWRLLLTRILYPASKRASFELSEQFLDNLNIDVHHLYRGLEIMAKEFDLIQAQVYKNSDKVLERDTRILYYDCTNFYFEMEEEGELQRYGKSKENRPNPIVQMGLFIDGQGIPLAINIQKGNTNEQVTLKPLEEKLIKDFACSKFIVCTDAGLSSLANRRYNDLGDRAFITTQSIKQLKKELKEWALEPTGWHVGLEPPQKNKEEHTRKKKVTAFDLRKVNLNSKNDYIFSKERWINEKGLSQRLVVTFSTKHYKNQRAIRQEQIERAQNMLQKNKGKLDKSAPNSHKRFIKQVSVTPEGELAEKKHYFIDEELIKSEGIYDGFYAVCTNLEGKRSEIIKINQQRWEIEESFRIMKTEFKTRPVYLSNTERITAHFMTCFLALLLYRILEKRLEENFTCQEILSTLRHMDVAEIKGEGYIPVYERTDLTDTLHDTFGFRTDYQITPHKKMKQILKDIKIK